MPFLEAFRVVELTFNIAMECCALLAFMIVLGEMCLSGLSLTC